MTTTENTLVLSGPVIGKGRGSTSDPAVDARADELLRSSNCNPLDRRVIRLLDSEDPTERAQGVNLAEIQLAQIRDEQEQEAKVKRDAALKAEAKRMAENWTNIATALTIRRFVPLFVTLCTLSEFVSEDKQAEVTPLIEQFDNCIFSDPWAVFYWAMRVQKLMPYLERRQQLVLERRAKKAKREKGNPATQPGVNWAHQASIPVAPASYLAGRVQGGKPQRGVTKAKPRDGMGRAKR